MYEINSLIVGATIKPYYFQVNCRQMQNYAASLLEDKCLHYLFSIGKEILPHPLFPVRISWQIIERLNDLLSVKLPINFLDNLLHNSEYLKIYKLIEPEDKLTIRGEIVALNPHKLGAKITIKLDYIDLQNKPILTEFIGAILFKVKCSDQGRILRKIPEIERINITTPIWEEQFQVSRNLPYIYDGCNEINYPIHTDPQYAQSKGLPDIILQGTATLAKSVSTVIQRELNFDPRRIKIISGKFTDIVIPPNLLSVRLLKKTQHDLYFDVSDQKGKFVLRGGYINFI
jgi:hypothetical protein